MKTPHLLSAALLLGVLLPAQSGDQAAPKGAIQIDDLKAWLATLTSPEFGGRGTGQDGFKLAAEFMRERYREFGLVALPQSADAKAAMQDHYQVVPWGTAKVLVEQSYVSFARGDEEVLRIPADRINGTVSAKMAATGAVVLVLVDEPKPPAAPAEGGDRRRGMQMPEIPGLADLDVAGKVVVVVTRKGSGDGDSPVRRMVPVVVMRALQGKDAAALLFADPDAEAQEGGLGGRAGANRGAGRAARGARMLPANLTIVGDDAKKLLAAYGKDVPANGTQLVPLGFAGTIRIETEETKLPAFNVVAVLPGSDPKLKDEYVVIGSHLDHLGRRGETFFPGADDDGSGTVGVLAVAKAFANSGKKPRRSILFVNFCGEENGLIGSRFFVENPPIPLSSIAAELQMDMIGRDEEENMEGNRGEKAEDNRNSLHLVGTQKLSPALHELCLKHNETAKFDIEYDQETMYGRSDHANFGNRGIPIAFFFTGLHRDYHQPSDTAEKINYEKLARIAGYVYAIARDLADSDERPHVDPALWTKNGRGGEPAAPLRKL